MNNTAKDTLIFIFLTAFILLILFILPISIIEYYSSCQEARIFNELHKTDYTCQDFFWAGDQINTQTQTIKLSK